MNQTAPGDCSAVNTRSSSVHSVPVHGSAPHSTYSVVGAMTNIVVSHDLSTYGSTEIRVRLCETDAVGIVVLSFPIYLTLAHGLPCQFGAQHPRWLCARPHPGAVGAKRSILSACPVQRRARDPRSDCSYRSVQLYLPFCVTTKKTVAHLERGAHLVWLNETFQPVSILVFRDGVRIRRRTPADIV